VLKLAGLRPKTLVEPFYERQKGESSAAWAAFVVYRDDEEGRSYRKCAEKVGKNSSLIERWGARWQWQQRVAAHDADADRAARESLRKERLEFKRAQITVGSAQVSLGAQRLRHADPQDLTIREAVMLITEGFRQQSLGYGEATEITAQVETQEQRKARLIAAARKTFREGRIEFPDYPEHKLKKRIADHFGITPKEIDESSDQ
jgi:hypothetical protein